MEVGSNIGILNKGIVRQCVPLSDPKEMCS